MTPQFESFYKHFRQTELWRNMANTREDSPWHREGSVAIHTEMLVDWYNDNLASSRNTTMQNLSLVACVMHDIGKPSCQVVKESAERGVYRSYAGHEAYSARMWMDYAIQNFEFITNTFKFDIRDIHNIAMMVEHHLPFDLKNVTKRKNLKSAFVNRMGEFGHQAWLDFIMSDQHGRVSDDQVSKLEKVDQWFKEWKEMEI